MAPEQDADVTRVAFDQQLFDVEAVKRAAYRFTDTVAAEIACEGGQIICTLRQLSKSTDLQTIANRLRNEVLDQDLRIRVARETEPVRNLILSLAFSKTNLRQ